MIEAILTYGARRPIISLVLVAALSVAAAGGLLQLRIDTSYDSLISENDPGRPAYQRTVTEFGSDNTTIVYIRDPDLFSYDKLVQIEDLTYELAELDSVEEVESLFTVLNIRDEDGALDTNPIMDTAPEEPEEIARVRGNALYSPLVRRNFISDDGTATAINITVLRDRKDPKFNLAIESAIERLIAPLRANFQQVFQVGPPRLNVEIERGMFEDLSTLSPISTLILIGSIIFFLRTSMAAAIPMATSAISIVWTFGFMGYAGLPLTLLTAIVPSLVIVIGSTEDTHMLSSYLHGIREQDKPDRRRAIMFMARHVGLPIFITSFTTSVGFFSNAVNEIPLIREFAYATSFAMVANLVTTILVLPLMLRYLGPKKSRLAPESERPSGLVGVLVGAIEMIVERHSRAVIMVTIALMVVFGYFATTIRVSNDPLSYFKSGSSIVQDAGTLHRDLSGMQIFYLTLDAKRPGAFKDPEYLKIVESVVAFLNQQGSYDKVISLADYVALVNREMNGADPAFFRVPDTRTLIEQYLLLFQRNDIARYVTADYSRANIVVRHNLSDSHVLNARLAALRAALGDLTGGKVSYTLTGENLMINNAAESLFVGQIQSLGLLVVIIFVVMSLLYTSAMAGLISLVPNGIPLVLNFGIMGLLGIPLNPGTATVAAIAVGIAIDDTIHLMTRYNAECRRNPDQRQAIRQTVWAESVPVVSTSISLALGFGILFLSQFAIVSQFGALAAATMIYAMLSDLLVTPIVLRRLRLAGIWDIIGVKVGKEVLLESPLFQGMSAYQIRKAIVLSHLVEAGRGEQVVAEGETGRSMYMVLSGRLEVSRRTGGESRQLDTLGPSDIFGEVGYARDIERTATVRALEDTELLAFEFAGVQRALRFYPRIASRLNLNIARVLGERLGDANGRLAKAGLDE